MNLLTKTLITLLCLGCIACGSTDKKNPANTSQGGDGNTPANQNASNGITGQWQITAAGNASQALKGLSSQVYFTDDGALMSFNAQGRYTVGTWYREGNNMTIKTGKTNENALSGTLTKGTDGTYTLAGTGQQGEVAITMTPQQTALNKPQPQTPEELVALLYEGVTTKNIWMLYHVVYPYQRTDRDYSQRAVGVERLLQERFLTVDDMKRIMEGSVISKSKTTYTRLKAVFDEQVAQGKLPANHPVTQLTEEDVKFCGSDGVPLLRYNGAWHILTIY